MLSHVPFILFCIGIAGSPVYLGGNRPVAVGVIGAIFFVSAALFVWLRVDAGVTRFMRRNRVVLVLIAAWLVYQWAFMLPMPSRLVGLVNPNPIGTEVSAGPGADGSAISYLAVLRENVGPEALLSTCLAIIFLLAAFFSKRRQYRKAILFTMVGVSIAEILLSIGGFLLGYGGAGADTSFSRITGTFINPNHLAGLLELGLGACLAIAFGRSWIARADGGKSYGSRHKDRYSTQGAICFVVILFGIFLTVSRGAYFATLTSIGIALVWIRPWRDVHLPKELVVGLLLAIGVVGILLAPGIGRLFMAEAGQGRWDIWLATVHMIADHPLFGVGPGGYTAIIASYKPPHFFELSISHAHNDYLEFFAESGLIGMILLVAVALHIFLPVFRSIRQRASASDLGPLLSVGLGAFLIHALVEFNLQIPSNAMWFAALCGMVVASTDANNRRFSKRARGTQSHAD